MELEADRAYQSLTTRMLGLATERARAADVRGIERLVADIHAARSRARRPSGPTRVTALLGSVEAELDAARQSASGARSMGACAWQTSADIRRR